MKILLTLKHWQLILCFVALTIAGWVTKNTSYEFIILAIIALSKYALAFGWFYTVGTFLQERIFLDGYKNPPFFRAHIAITFALAIVVRFFEILLYTNIASPLMADIFTWIQALFMLSSITCYFRCAFLVARALNIVEIQGEVKFNDYVRDFISLIFFVPFGLLVCQPRVNEMVEGK